MNRAIESANVEICTDIPISQLRHRWPQTSTGMALYRHYGLDPINYETNVLLMDGRAWFKSEGSIKMFELLGFPWSLFALGRLLPLQLRDGIYNVIARNRLRWFGAREQCMLSDPAHADRFIT